MTAEFDEQIITQTVLKKYYTPKMIQIGTFLGGPLIAGYFIGDNYKSFSQPEKSRIAWVYAALATAIVFAAVIFIPDNDNRSNGPFRYIIPLLYSWATYGLVKYLQTDLIKLHADAGGAKYGWGRVILISLIGAAVTFAALLVTLTILTALFPYL